MLELIGQWHFCPGLRHGECNLLSCNVLEWCQVWMISHELQKVNLLLFTYTHSAWRRALLWQREMFLNSTLQSDRKKDYSPHLWLLSPATVIYYHRAMRNASLEHLLESCGKSGNIGLAICDAIPNCILTPTPLWWLILEENKKASYKWWMTNNRSPIQELFKEESDKKVEVSWIMLGSCFLPCCLM